MKNGFSKPLARRHNTRVSSSELVVVGVSVSSLTSYLGTGFGQDILKVATITFILLAAYGTARLLRTYRHAFYSGAAVPFLFLCSVLPVSRIAIEVVPTFSRRDIIDGLAIIAPYYMLPFAALGLVATIACKGVNFSKVLARPLLFTAVIICSFASMGYYTLDSSKVAGTYTIYNNFLLPLAFCFFLGGSSHAKVASVFAILFIFSLSSLQGSRSYMLVAGYIVIIATLFGGRNAYMKYLTIGVLAVFLTLGLPFFTYLLRGAANTLVIMQKLRIDSLSTAIEIFMENGDLLALYFWEGNSRATILIDAFFDFNWSDYMWGRGTSATYDSFVTRTTIEIGYAQELFWLGAVTLVPVLWFSLRSVAWIAARPEWRRSRLGKFLVAVTLVRFLDGLIYGMPSSSLYMLIYWMAMAWMVLKPAHRSAFFRNTLPQKSRIFR